MTQAGLIAGIIAGTAMALIALFILRELGLPLSLGTFPAIFAGYFAMSAWNKAANPDF